MSANTRQLLAFIVFICVWSLIGNAALAAKIHPVAVAVVWLVGFVWGVGFIVAGKADADLLTKRWLQMLVGVVAFGSVMALFLS